MPLLPNLATVLALMTTSLTAASTIPDAVKEAVRARVDQGLAPAMVVGVINGDAVEFFAHGTTGGGGSPVDEHTVFEIGSITKVFTGILLAEMSRTGEVTLDSSVEACLPEDLTLPARGGEGITLERLATHTSGLPRLPRNFQPADMNNPYADFTVADLHRAITRVTLQSVPGETYAYSNLGAGLLGHALAQAAGSGYETLVRTRITAVIDMPNTAITLTDSMQSRLAIGHANGEPVLNWDLPTLAGAGALRSTAADMIRFIQANLGLIDTPLMPALEESHRPRADADAPGTRIALGWHVTKTSNGSDIVWHNGGTGGYRAAIGFNKESKTGAVVLANAAADVADDMGFHILDPAQPLKTFEEQEEITLAKDILQDYTGRYQIQPGAVFDVELRGDQLHVRLTGQDFHPVYPESETKFFYKVVEATITFERDPEDTVTALTLHQGGVTITAERLQ